MAETTSQVHFTVSVPPKFDLETLHSLGEWLLNTTEPLKMTYEEFLAWADEDTLAEWVNGEVMMTSPASNQHQDISDFLTALLRIYVQSRNLGVVRSAPFQMKLTHGREPDLLFIQQAHLNRLKSTYLDGPADLVVEIVSPESIGRDRGDKFYEYAQGGVPEYWLIDPQRQQAEFYELQGRYYTLRLGACAGRYESLVVPGFWLNIEWLWQAPLPLPIRALAEIVGMDPPIAAAFEQALQG